MIDIVMATYNGEKYLEAQLLSLISQTHKNWSLHIYDDCSTDGTVDIINKFIKIDSRIHFYQNKRNLGCALTFLNGIKNSSAEFIMLCDQDDIWFDNKVFQLYNFIKDEKKLPCIGLAKGVSFNQNINKVTGFINLNEPKSLNEFLLNNGGLQGCSMIINKKLINLVLEVPSEIVMHDHYLSLLAFSFGKVKYLNMDLMLYRRHEKAVTTNFYGSFLSKAYNYITSKPFVIDYHHYIAIKSFYNENYSRFQDKEIQLFKAYLSLKDENILKVFFVILKFRFLIRGSILFSFLSFFLKRKIGNNQKQNLYYWK
ncbi:glycosyltransferase [Acinetobacter sp. 16]|uniref:glycosyltransferase n=1 Tax=Acinetobacter sp. 16 TaxID=3081771 RepID=UPI00296ED762|nr:glycosyltransferase [Acinetobacter sp. 16]